MSRRLRMSRADVARLNARRPRLGTMDRDYVDSWCGGMSYGDIAARHGHKPKYIENRIRLLRLRYGAQVAPYRTVTKKKTRRKS